MAEAWSHEILYCFELKEQLGRPVCLQSPSFGMIYCLPLEIRRYCLPLDTAFMGKTPSWEAQQFLSQSSSIPNFIETCISSPSLQQPITCTYPEPDRSISRFQLISLTHILYCISIYDPDFNSSFSLRFSYQNPTSRPPLAHTCNMSCLSHYFLFDGPNKNWWVQIVKLLTLLPLPAACCLVPLRPKYLSQHQTSRKNTTLI